VKGKAHLRAVGRGGKERFEVNEKREGTVKDS